LLKVCAAGAFLFFITVFSASCSSTTNLGVEPLPTRSASLALPVQASLNAVGVTANVGPVNVNAKWYADQD